VPLIEEGKIFFITETNVNNKLKETHDKSIHGGFNDIKYRLRKMGEEKIKDAEIKRFLRHCETCQKNNHKTKGSEGYSSRFEVPARIGEYMVVDIFGPTEIGKRKYNTIVLTDRLTRFTWTRSLARGVKSADLAEFVKKG
jgi:hypothetical protein